MNNLSRGFFVGLTVIVSLLINAGLPPSVKVDLIYASALVVMAIDHQAIRLSSDLQPLKLALTLAIISSILDALYLDWPLGLVAVWPVGLVGGLTIAFKTWLREPSLPTLAIAFSILFGLHRLVFLINQPNLTLWLTESLLTSIIALVIIKPIFERVMPRP